MLALDADWIDQLYVDPELTRGGIGAELIGVVERERPDGLRWGPGCGLTAVPAMLDVQCSRSCLRASPRS